jgi:hypothetical protein
MFPTFERCRPSNETKANRKLSMNHLGAFQKHFSFYFKVVHVSKCEWVRNPFAAHIFSGLTTCEQEQLIDKLCDGSLNDVFDADELPQF